MWKILISVTVIPKIVLILFVLEFVSKFTVITVLYCIVYSSRLYFFHFKGIA